MRDILNVITSLEGFVTNEDFQKGISFAQSRDMGPCICGEYGGPPYDDDDQDLKDDDFRRQY